MSRLGLLAPLGLALSACTMPNPAFETGRDSLASGDNETVTEDPTVGDGDPESTDPNGDGDPSDTEIGEDCEPDEIECDDACVVPNTNDHCGSCEACDGECVDEECFENRFMFVTNMNFPGSLQEDGEDPDELCQDAAIAGMLPGTYIAWLADLDNSPTSQLSPKARFIRPDDVPIALGIDDLLDGTLMAPLNVSELGVVEVGQEPCLEEALVWTGILPDGTAAMHHCDEWTNIQLEGGIGDLRAVDSAWTHADACEELAACMTLRRLYCVQL